MLNFVIQNESIKPFQKLNLPLKNAISANANKRCNVFVLKSGKKSGLPTVTDRY